MVVGEGMEGGCVRRREILVNRLSLFPNETSFRVKQCEMILLGCISYSAKIEVLNNNSTCTKETDLIRIISPGFV